MLLGLSEFTHAKGLDEFLAQINICDHHCSFHSKSLLKVSWDLFLTRPALPIYIYIGWTLSSFRTSFRRCLTLNDILPSFSYLAGLFNNSFLADTELIWSFTLLNLEKLSRSSSINSVFFWVWRLLCETGVFILSSGNSTSVGVTVCHSGSLTHRFLICSISFPQSGTGCVISWSPQSSLAWISLFPRWNSICMSGQIQKAPVGQGCRPETKRT